MFRTDRSKRINSTIRKSIATRADSRRGSMPKIWTKIRKKGGRHQWWCIEGVAAWISQRVVDDARGVNSPPPPPFINRRLLFTYIYNTP